MVLNVESEDREAVDKQILASLWGQKAIRLTASLVNGRYIVSAHSIGDEPDGESGTTMLPSA